MCECPFYLLLPLKRREGAGGVGTIAFVDLDSFVTATSVSAGRESFGELEGYVAQVA